MPFFKVGDEVYLASPQGGQFGTIVTVGSFDVAEVDFENYRVSVSTKYDLYLASELDRNALPLSSYEQMLIERSKLFKPGAAIMECHFGYGVVIEVLPSGMACVDFKCYGRQHVETRTFNAWQATEEDKSWMPRQREAEPEPMCEPEDATIENLQVVILHWENVPQNIEAGFDDDPDEYFLDLYVREELHGILNGLASRNVAVSEVLNARIDAADKRFIGVTSEIACHAQKYACGSPLIYDKTIFWYYYRWSKK